MEVPGKVILKEVPQIWKTNPVCFLLFVDFSFDFFLYTVVYLKWSQRSENSEESMESRNLRKIGCAPNLIYLNAQSPLGETIWEVLGGMAFAGEVCHWGVGFEIPKLHAILSYLLLFWTCGSDVNSQLLFQEQVCLSAAMLPVMMVMYANHLKSWNTMKWFLF